MPLPDLYHAPFLGALMINVQQTGAMTTMKKIITVCVALAALLLAGCGGQAATGGQREPSPSKSTKAWTRAQCGQANENQWIDHGCDAIMAPKGTKPPKHDPPTIAEGETVTYPFAAETDDEYGDVFYTTVKVTLLKVHEVKVQRDGYDNPTPDEGKRWYCLKFKVENTGKYDDGSLGMDWAGVVDDGEQIDAQNNISCPSYQKTGRDVSQEYVDAGSWVTGWASVEVSTQRTVVTNGHATIDTPEIDLFKIEFPAE